MIKHFFLICMIFICCLACQKQPIMPEVINDSIAEVKSKFAPDKRVAIFDLTPSMDGKVIQIEGFTNLPEAKKELFKTLLDKGFEVNDKIEVLPSQSLEKKTVGLVNVSVCNIRSVPKHSGELSTQSLLGTPLKVYRQEGDWYLVQTPDAYLGWLDAGAFVRMEEAELDAWLKAPKVIYLPANGFSYEAAKLDGNPVSDLSTGNLLQFIEHTSENSVKVAYPDGREAYISSNEVSLFDQWLGEAEAHPESIIKTAFTYMGRPYLWGGTSARGIDCSGFTKMVFYMNGMVLPRDASQQVHTGIDVPTDTTLKNLLAGDLLFFGRKATAEQKERITHVAIYLGDGKVIHATGMVKVESLRRGDPNFAEDRLNTFVRAKRPFETPMENGILPLKSLAAYNPAID